MKEQLRIVMVLILALILYAVGYRFFGTSSSIDLENRDYAMGEGVSDGWLLVCLYGQHEFPTVPEGFSKALCDLEPGYDVPSGQTYMVYFYEDKQCEKLKFGAFFLAENTAESRCFSKADFEYLDFHYEDGVINLKVR